MDALQQDTNQKGAMQCRDTRRSLLFLWTQFDCVERYWSCAIVSGGWQINNSVETCEFLDNVKIGACVPGLSHGKEAG